VLTQDAANTLALAQELLDAAKIAIHAYLTEHLQQCDGSLQSCRDWLRGQLDAAVKLAWDKLAGAHKEIRDNLAYLMSEAEQYASFLGYGQNPTSVPPYATADELQQRVIDYLHTGVGPRTQPLAPGRQVVGPRAETPQVQTALDYDTRNLPQSLTVSPLPYAPPTDKPPSGVTTPLPTTVQQSLSSVPTVGPTQPPVAMPLPTIAAQSVATVSAVVGIPGALSPEAILPVAVAPGEPLTSPLDLTGGGGSISPMQVGQPGLRGRGPAGLAVPIAGPAVIPGALGTQSNPWTFDTAGGNDWPLVKPGDWFKLADGVPELAFPSGVVPPSPWLSGAKLNANLGGYVLPTALPAGPPQPVTPIIMGPQGEVCPVAGQPVINLTPWQIANCTQPTPVRPGTPIVTQPVSTCPVNISFDTAAICNCLASLTPLPFPIDIDQMHAFRFSPDDAEWKAAALAFEGPWLQRANNASDINSYASLVLEHYPTATDSSD
jgi:hypothetical protein